MLFDFSDEQVKRAKGGAWISPEGKVHFVSTSFEHWDTLYAVAGLKGRGEAFKHGWVHVGFYAKNGNRRSGQAVDEVTFSFSSKVAIPALTAAARLARYADLNPARRVTIDPTHDWSFEYGTPEGRADEKWIEANYLSTLVKEAGSPDAAMKAAGTKLMAIAVALNAERRAASQENDYAQAA